MNFKLNNDEFVFCILLRYRYFDKYKLKKQGYIIITEFI